MLSEFRNNDNGLTLRTGLLRRGFLHQAVSGADSQTNSVLIASKFPCGSALFPDSDQNFPHAIVRGDFDAFYLYGVYLPHKKKHRLFDFLCDGELEDDTPSIIIGDWNTGKNRIDQEGTSFWYSEYLDRLERRGWCDAFRRIHGDTREYSWFSHQGNGYRYDHCYLSKSLEPVLRDFEYCHESREAGLSDHSAMILTLGQ